MLVARKNCGYLVLILSLYTNCIFSATFEYKTLSNQVRSAELIIQGAFVSKRSEEVDKTYMAYAFENNEKVEFEVSKRTIETLFTFSIANVMKGDYEDRFIEVSAAGGCVEDKCIDYSHSYSFEDDENAVLFLNKHLDGSYFALNASFDVFKIDENNILVRKAGSVVYPENWKTINEAMGSKEITLDALMSEIKESEIEK